MPAKSIKQQRFMGMVRRAQKTGQASSPEVAEVAASMKKKDAKDFASTKHKGLPMKKEEFINEEDYDRMKDRQMERGTFRPRSKPNVARSGGSQPKKKNDSGMSALDFVKNQIRAKHGHGAIYEPKKKNEGYAPGDVDQKVGAVTAIPKKEQDDARARILAKAKAKREARLNKEELESIEEKKKGLWANIHAKRKRGEKPAKPGDKDYPETLNVENTINERGDFWHPDPEKDRKLGGPGANQRAREDRAAASKPKEDPKKLRPGESYMQYAKRQQASKMRKEEVEGKSFKQFLEEGNRTGRMMQKSKTQVTGHISADRGDDEKKNKEGRKNLEKDLKKHGIGHKKGVGEYKYGSGETGREVSYQTSKPDNMSKRRFGKVMRRLGRKHGQESVITKDKDKSAKLHYTEKGSKAKSDSIGKTKAGKHPEGYGETSGTKVRSGKLPKKTNKGSFHYG